MRTGVAGVDAVVLIDQRLVSVFLGSESPCHIFTAFHDAAALVVEAQNRWHAVPASAALQRGGEFFAIADASGGCSCTGRETGSQDARVALSGLTAPCTQGCMALRRQETIAVALGHYTFRNEGLLLHSRLGAQGSGHIVQIPDFISLICRKGNRLEQTVSACGHPAVYAKRCRNIAGQIAIVPIKAFHIILVWLCDKGLHLHIVSGH